MLDMTTSTHSSIFFATPREIRDKIYHHVFQSNRCLYAPFPPQATYTTKSRHCIPDLQLRYQLLDKNSRAHSHRYNVADHGNDWLFTCKAIMYEATEQFVRNAEWFWPGYPRLHCNGCSQCAPLGLYSLKEDTGPHASPINTSRITRMELYVQNLANFESPYRYQGTDVNSDLKFLADVMRCANFSLNILRFVGHSYLLRNAARRKSPPAIYTSTNIDQIPNIMQRLMSHFHSIDIRKWEFGVVDQPYARYWVLFEWVDGAGLRLLRNEGPLRRPDPRPEEDLEKLLPKGWVLKRPTCGDDECDDCNPL